MDTVLRLAIVCNENRCRSALAECAMRRDWAGRAFYVSSAGLEEADGRPPLDSVRAAALDAGLLMIESHVSHGIREAALNYADLILVMEEQQREEVLLRLARFTGRVYRLGHWRGIDIPDPLRYPGCSVSNCLELIRACLGDWAAHLQAAGLLPTLIINQQGVMDHGYRDAL